MPDAELLLAFAATGSQAPFAELVSRHLGLVYGSALRQLRGDHHRAQEVTQMVFIALARKAARLADHPALPAWLHRSTQLAAADLLRREARRTNYETAAAREIEMLASDSPADWSRVRPILDQSIDRLGSADRAVILLRYFSALPYGEIGRRLRLTENAARMRVERALDKLRQQLSRQGFATPGAVLATWLTNEASAALPAGVAASTGAIALTAAGAIGSATAGIGITAFITSHKFALTALGLALVASGAGVAWEKSATRQFNWQSAELGRQIGDETAAEQEHTALLAAKHQREEQESLLESLPTQLQATRAQIETIRNQLSAAARAKRMAAATSPLAAATDAGKLDAPPSVTFQPPPQYPAALRAAGVSGQVMVDFIVDRGGFVRDAKILSATNPLLEPIALDAVNQWTFSPGMRSGSPTDTHLAVPILFQLHHGPQHPPPPVGMYSPQDWFPPKY